MKMENNSRNRSLVVLAALAGLALLMTLVLRDTATIHAAMKQKATKKLAQSGNAVAGTDPMAYVTSAPYPDGLFQRKLPRGRGELGRVSAGRWSSRLDRSAYADGYLEGFDGPANSSSIDAVK